MIIITYQNKINHLKLNVACIYICIVGAEEARAPSDPGEVRARRMWTEGQIFCMHPYYRRRKENLESNGIQAPNSSRYVFF